MPPGLTPEQARDLVEHFGGIRPAARAAGLHYTTLWRALRPDQAREQNRRAGSRYRESGRGAERSRRYRERRNAEGLCQRCGTEPLLSETLCWSCLNKLENRTLNV